VITLLVPNSGCFHLISIPYAKASYFAAPTSRSCPKRTSRLASRSPSMSARDSRSVRGVCQPVSLDLTSSYADTLSIGPSLAARTCGHVLHTRSAAQNWCRPLARATPRILPSCGFQPRVIRCILVPMLGSRLLINCRMSTPQRRVRCTYANDSSDETSACGTPRPQ